MSISTLLACAFVMCCVTLTDAHKYFQLDIPNGQCVPDPMSATSSMWAGVGHFNSSGSGTLNQFGLDFNANDQNWDAFLCNRDSDGDGKTNGEELGDPDCIWKSEGVAPSTKVGISHPGICEPVNSETCRGLHADIVIPKREPFLCPAFMQDGVVSTDIQSPVTVLPAQETVYMCAFVPLNLRSTQHIIGYEPIIDNEKVARHTVIFGCKADQTAAMVNRSLSEPWQCEGEMTMCADTVILWTLGNNGACYPEDFGMLVGEGGYTSLIIQQYYINPTRASGLTDTSGVRLYHTAALREHSAAYVFWGTNAFELPVGATGIGQTAYCPAECTNDIANESVFISEIIPYMHYYGRSLTVRHSRPGEFELRTILEEYYYHYDRPKTLQFDPPLEVRRGDSIEVNCTYDTRRATEPVFGGSGMYDEMCYMMALVFPFDSSVPTYCQVQDGHGFCQFRMVGDYDDCVLSEMMSPASVQNITATLSTACDMSGVACLDGCGAAIEDVSARYACLRGDTERIAKLYLRYFGRFEITRMLASCKQVRKWRHEGSHGDTGEQIAEECVAQAASPSSHVIMSLSMLGSAAASVLLLH